MQNLLCILNQGELLKCQKTPQAINEFTYFEARFILKASHISQWLKLIMSPHATFANRQISWSTILLMYV